MTPAEGPGAPAGSGPSRGEVVLFLAGDVMTGRGIDQVLPHPVAPVLHEPVVKDARRYVELAETAHGPIPAPVESAYPWGEALEELERTGPELRVANLETAITAGGRPWEGKGIHYRMHPRNVPVLRALGLDACSLANNHALDWGRRGLLDTLAALEGAGIAPAGAGRDAVEAAAPAALELEGGGRFLLFGLGSTTSGIPPAWAASEGRPGVRLLPDLSERTAAEVAGEILERRRPGDLVGVSVHWGPNWGHRIPRSERRFARRLVEEGAADLVHGHSSHHAKAVEVYRGRLILYGCGDFLTDYEGIPGYETFRDDLVLAWFPSVERSTGALLGLRMAPFRLRRFRLERPPREDAEWLAETLDRESRKLGSRILLRPDGRLQLGWMEDGGEE